MLLITKPVNTIEIIMMSNGKGKTWLIITDGGNAIYHHKINPEEKKELINAGIELYVDEGMSDPS